MHIALVFIEHLRLFHTLPVSLLNAFPSTLVQYYPMLHMYCTTLFYFTYFMIHNSCWCQCTCITISPKNFYIYFLHCAVQCKFKDLYSTHQKEKKNHVSNYTCSCKTIFILEMYVEKKKQKLFCCEDMLSAKGMKKERWNGGGWWRCWW